MSALAPTLEKFFTVHLATSLGASTHTIAAYRDTWRLLITHTIDRTGTDADRLDIGQIDSDLVTAFLDQLQQERGNSVPTRNARLAAIHSFFNYAACWHPEHAALISRILAIPLKRHQRCDITYLNEAETQALLQAPNNTTTTGRRDHALLLTAITTGLRVSELTALTWADIHLGNGAHLLCHGKGRKNRATPLDKDTVNKLRQWRKECNPNNDQPVFPTQTGTPMSTDAVAQRLAIYVSTTAKRCPSLATKKITPHVLRHTTAMRMLHAGIDTSVIALWLGHENVETTHIYLHADMNIKETALERIRPINTTPGRYRPKASVLTFLESL